MAVTRVKKRKAATVTPQIDPDLQGMYGYCDDVIAGRILVSKWTVLAFQRFRNDLERSKRPDCNFYFDEEAASRALRFIRLLSHAKGDIAGQPLELHAWAVFFVANLFGWRIKGTGTRRFRKVFAFVPRGNSKSTTLSACALYAGFAEGGQADVFSLATTREQARIVWGDAATMMRNAPELRNKLGVEVLAHSIVQTATNSSFKPLASEATTLDGLNVSFGVLDELHEVPRELAEIITTALGKRANSVLVSISTAGFDTSSYGREQYLYGRQILNGEVQDDLVFFLPYECPEGMNPYTVEAQKAANPMYGLSVRPEILAQAAMQAQRLPGSRAAYLVKHLGIWQDSSAPWLDMAKWDACYDPDLDRTDFAGEPCYIGLDLANRSDITCKALVFPRQRDDGETEYCIFVDSYLPENAVTDGRNDAYVGWADQGFIVSTPGDVTDFRTVKAHILEDGANYQIRKICCDPTEANQLLGDLQDEGYETVEVKTTFAHMNETMKSVESLVMQGRIRHDGNPALRWMIGNVFVARRDEQIRPVKETKNSPKKIDGAVAILTAMNQVTSPETSSIYEERGIVFI